MQTTPGTYDYDITSNWNSGYVAEWSFAPEAATDSWQVTIRLGGDIVNIWNARIISRDGDFVTLGNASWNGSLFAGQTTTFGFQVSGIYSGMEVVGGSVEPVVPEVSVGNVSVLEGDPTPSGETPADDGVLTLPLSTSGNAIVDADGDPVQLAGVSWFGAETTLGTPHGLWTRNWQEMVDEIAAAGFNLIRLPFSSVAVTTEYVPTDIDFGLNPDLVGLDTLEILEKIVEYAAEKDLMILLDNHRTFPGNGPNGNGLWYDGAFTEDDWVDMWEMLAARFGDDPNVIGADLQNEPHGADWATWSTAAERAGNAIHAVDPDWLIFVEGVAQHPNNDYYWWGGNLKGVATDPVVLNTPNKLVYSPHDYPPSVFNQPWFNDGSDLTEIFREYWGFIHEQEIAPVVVGEMGSKLGAGDLPWFEAIRNYLLGDTDGDGALDPGADPVRPGFIWWSWNPNSGDTGGILQDDWRTIDQAKLDAIAPLLAPRDPIEGDEGTLVTFTVSLDAALSSTLVLDFATRDGTAVAGSDYEATSGTITFAPGETAKTVSVRVLADDVAEADETFFLDVTGSGVSVTATATIENDDGDPGPGPDPEPEPEPVASVADVSVAEEAGVAELTISLDRDATAPVTIAWTTADGSAVAGEDYAPASGEVTIAAGERSALVTVGLVDDAIAEDPESFLVRLTSADGAILGDAEASVTVEDTDVPPPPVTGLVAELTLVNDWLSGAQVGIVVRNVGETIVDGWSLAFDAPFTITQLWGGQLTTSGGEASVTNLSWNGILAPGQTADVGFLTADGSAFDMAAWTASTEVDVALL